ncbi:MAG TPA: fused MFS/spermidine synthase [Acidimicrobiia bacterium]
MSQTLARILVFFTSAAILVIEIVAGRLLAPYVGVSLEVFTAIIGVILAGISLGAWLGGKVADRVDPTLLPGPLLIAGGVLALVSPLVVQLVGPAAGGSPGSIVVVTALAFFAPAAVLAAVTPVVVKIRLTTLAETGSVVGGYSAIGTAGAIVGTFVTGFFLIASFPTRPIVAGVGVLLILGGSWLIISRSRWATVAVAAMGCLSAFAVATSDGPCLYETTYHCADVLVDEARPSGRILVLDRGHNSYVDLEDPTYLDFRYTNVMADVIDVDLEEGPLDVLSIGGGGFTFPHYLDATRPGTSHTVLEIDGDLETIAQTHLGFTDQADVIAGDARATIAAIPDDSVDLVIGDAFSGYTVPWHLTTVEFNEIVNSKMRSDGIYVINVIDEGGLDFARAAASTFRGVFEHVAVIAPPEYLAGLDGGNFVIVGSQAELELNAILDRIRSRGGIENAIEGTQLDEFIGSAPILRDDFAPVDQMLSSG